MLIIGLTGGIASGKSTVAEAFHALGIPVYDADVIARDLLRPGSPAYSATVEEFGDAIVDAEGRIMRRRLRDIVFADPERRLVLENILHPRVREALLLAAQQAHDPYCILCVPLLVESGMTDLVNRVLVVDISAELQLKRLCQRDGMTRETAQRMVSAQATREQRLGVADDIIDNNGELAALQHQVQELHQKYCRISGS